MGCGPFWRRPCWGGLLSGPRNQAGVDPVGSCRERLGFPLALARLQHSFWRMNAEFLMPTVPDLMEKKKRFS